MPRSILRILLAAGLLLAALACGHVETAPVVTDDAVAADAVDVADAATATDARDDAADSAVSDASDAGTDAADAAPEDVAADTSDATEDAGPDADVADGEDVSPDAADAGCTSNADCAAAAGTLGPCETALCEAGACVVAAVPAGTPCGPVTCTKVGNLPVLEARICQGGACSVDPAQIACEDGHLCTTDSCDPAAGCLHVPSDAACGDGNPCTADVCDLAVGCSYAFASGACDDGDFCSANDSCAGGACQGGPGTCECVVAADCEPKGACLVAACVGSVCAPQAAAADTPCDDGNACTVQDACAAGGGCQGQAVACDDGLACTWDACAKKVGCLHLPNGVACDDGNPCTADVCDLTKGCTGKPVDGGPCDDGNACTAGDACSGGACSGPTPKACPDPGVCLQAACEAATGVCGAVPAADGSPCDDGNACSLQDACAAGVCTGKSNPCDDGNGCTLDLCQADGGCAHDPVAGPCNDDDDVCTEDQCQQGTCTAGAKKACDDKNPCTLDSCDKVKGCVVQAQAAGTPCGAGQWCLAGSCKKVVVPAGMLYVAADQFTMGCGAKDLQCKADEKPAHAVQLGSYAIDQLEVSAAKYKACVQAGACPALNVAGKADATYGVAGKEAFPVNYVTWNEAVAYCTWAGGSRLCTEAEWEFAARGTDGRKYPWGSTAPTCDLVNFAGCTPKGAEAVGSNPKGQSPVGAQDMAGNVREWTADWYGAGWYAELAKAGKVTVDPLGPKSGTSRVTRGGYWLDNAPELRTSGRSFAPPGAGAASLGFRCCRDPK